MLVVIYSIMGYELSWNVKHDVTTCNFETIAMTTRLQCEAGTEQFNILIRLTSSKTENLQISNT